MEQITQAWSTSIADLKASYHGTHRQLELARARTKDPIELGLLSNMISDVSYAIEWMRTARTPRNRRGIERRSAYQNTIFLEPHIMENFAQPDPEDQANSFEITEDMRFALKEALHRLSSREQQCYTMAKADKMSYDEIAFRLKLAKSSVQKYVERADSKVRKELESNLFLRR
ncbi:RNA polymerase subunit sigma-24 [Paenibacillus sp. WQ 127069]|uniref:RNA polymerase subunit sigma-24 n=1 Tax=Paenibacillus baimaensis TaxID=2982185 RepID=A0ABT2UKJ1_9BACL|nr:sigma factor-like helix-turn-helix DNA-binding protein [Paenibacillus sp. WQ 127069]MCU6795160.1 RNA polymerase subunit sigma-24 [Paenibacillus sp. WQ 127069]